MGHSGRTRGRLGSSLTLRQRAQKPGANCGSLLLLGAGRQGSACPAQACRGRPRPLPRRPALRASAGPLHGPGRAHWASKLRGLTPRAITSASRRRPPPSDNGPRVAAAVSSAGPDRRPLASRCPVGLQVRLPDLDVGLFYLLTFLRLLSSVFGFLSHKRELFQAGRAQLKATLPPRGRSPGKRSLEVNLARWPEGLNSGWTVSLES